MYRLVVIISLNVVMFETELFLIQNMFNPLPMGTVQ